MKTLFPNRSILNKSFIVLFVLIDTLAVILVFAVLHESQYELIKESMPGDWPWLIGPVGILGILLVGINALALQHSFPIDKKKVVLLFSEKIIAIIIVLLQGNSIATAIYTYSLAELAALSGGMGALLISYRLIIPSALYYYKSAPAKPSLLSKIKYYFITPEIVPTVLFAIPMVLWAGGLLYMGFMATVNQSTLPLIISIIGWMIVSVSLFEQRFRILLTYFKNWFLDYQKRTQS